MQNDLLNGYHTISYMALSQDKIIEENKELAK
jgi:hypothetical protein